MAHPDGQAVAHGSRDVDDVAPLEVVFGRDCGEVGEDSRNRGENFPVLFKAVPLAVCSER